ncbi:MAG: fumarylacetoacetate hydrolase family protein [Pseudomonadota bacterium]
MTGQAELLWNARKNGTVVEASAIPEPVNNDEAYAIQGKIAALSGYPIVGFKVGSTSAEAQRILGTSEPGSGPVLEPYYFTSPATVPIVAEQMPAVEGEFGFRMGKDLPAQADPYDVEDVAAAIDAVAGSIEVVGTRLAGGLAGKGRFLVTADGGANIALVTGAWSTTVSPFDLKDHAVSVSINGQQKGSGVGSLALGDPLNVMVWLANQQSRFGRGLKAGDIISTGTCTGLDGVKSGDHVVADYGSLGAVDITFS